MNDTLAPLPGDARADLVLRALRQANASISSADRRLKYCKMSSRPLDFYRGVNHLFWADFAADARLLRFGNAGTQTWLQGDLHAYNFGSYDDDAGRVVYGLNDFDEAIVADYQYDLWRMAVSLVLIARQNGYFGRTRQQSVVDAFAETYLDTLAAYRGNDDAAQTVFTAANTYGKLDGFLREVEREYSRVGMLDRWAPVTADGTRRFDLSRDKLGKATRKQQAAIRAALTPYRRTLTHDPARDENHFTIKDIARRLQAGTGSLGTPRFYVLIEGGPSGAQDDDRILDVKRQGTPAAYAFLGLHQRRVYDRAFENDAHRHAVAQRALTAHTDDHLGWMRLSDGCYSVRERSPFKEAFPGEALTTRGAFRKLAEQWGRMLATNHTRAGNALPKHVGRLTDGHRKAFRSLTRDVAFAYADQVEADWQTFLDTLHLDPGECDDNAFVPPTLHDTLLPD